MPVSPSDYKLKVLLGLPFAGSSRYTPPEWAVALATIAWPMNCRYAFAPTKNLPREQARTEIAERAIRHKAQYVAMLDDDIQPPPDWVQALVRELDSRPEFDIIAAICPSVNREPMVFAQQAGGPYWRWKQGDVFEIAECATACILIRTSVFESISKPWFMDLNTTEECVAAGVHVPGEQDRGAMTDDIYFCFPPKTRVYGDQLYIEEYKTGNLVLTQAGVRRNVADTNRRQYSGDLVKVCPKYGADFSVTPRHEILIERSGARQFVAADSIVPGDRLVVPIPSVVREDRRRYLPTWPFIRGVHVAFDAKKRFRYTKAHSEVWFPLQVALTPGFSRLGGYWCAEGSATDINISFTFHLNEKDYADDVVKLLYECFGLPASNTPYLDTKTRRVTCCSTALADFMKGTFGEGASNHRVPEDLLMGSSKSVCAFLQGFWRGDGTKRDHVQDFGLTTTSERLAHDLRLMLIKEKIYPSLDWGSGAFRLRIPSQFTKEWLAILGEQRRLRKTGRWLVMPWLQRNLQHEAGSYFAVAVDSVSRIPYEGDVFNLTVSA